MSLFPALFFLQVQAWCVDNTKLATFRLWLVCRHCISCGKKAGGGKRETTGLVFSGISV